MAADRLSARMRAAFEDGTPPEPEPVLSARTPLELLRHLAEHSTSEPARVQACRELVRRDDEARERRRVGQADGVGEASLAFAQRLASASDAQLDAMIDELAGPVLDEDRQRAERQRAALEDADAEADRRARVLAGHAASVMSAEMVMAARAERDDAVATANALELRLSEFESSGAPRRPRPAPPGIEPERGWPRERGRGSRDPLGGF